MSGERYRRGLAEIGRVMGEKGVEGMVRLAEDAPDLACYAVEAFGELYGDPALDAKRWGLCVILPPPAECSDREVIQMVKLTVLYGHPDDPAAFEEYYSNTHMPMVPQIPNLLRFEAARVVATPDGSEPPYYRIFEGYFEDMDQLQSGMSSPEGQTASNDLPNFATGGATIFISEVDA